MQKEMNEAARSGFRYGGVMGGDTAFGGKETVVVMWKAASNDANRRFEYKLLATNRTSTMQKEMQQASDEGYEYKGQTVFDTTFGGNEVVIIMERDIESKMAPWEYRLLATSRTSTMQKELNEAGGDGFQFVGLTVGKTSFGGNEIVSIMRRPRAQ
jgi:hypothetical protein